MLTPRPHTIYHSGKIYTVNPIQPWAEAVAVADGHILAVGQNAEILALAGAETERVDLGGRLTLPGLCDAHIHFYNWSITRQEVELAATRSKAEMMARIAERAATTPPGGWIVGNGWNESRWGETRFPDRHDLDAVTGPDRPAIFWRSDMHGAVANSAALALAGVTGSTPNPAGGVIDMDSAGQPTGFLRELAIGLVAFHIPAISSAALDAALAGGMAELHRLGITALHDQRMKDHDDGPQGPGRLPASAPGGAAEATHQLQHRRPRSAPPGRVRIGHGPWGRYPAPGPCQSLHRRQHGHPHGVDVGLV